MTANEMKEKYMMLYDYMASSNNPKYMKAFGVVMNDMMDWMIQNKPDVAIEEIERLAAIKWKNYLTQKEAEALRMDMILSAPRFS